MGSVTSSRTARPGFREGIRTHSFLPRALASFDRGSDFGREKHLQGGAEVRMLIQGRECVGWALPILDDPERSTAGLKTLRPRTSKLAEWIGSVFVEVQMQDQQD